MDFQLSNISMPVAALLASLIGATATITATLIQLRMAWLKEMKARARGQPVTKKARRGPVVAVVVLLIASGVGGFALSQYLVAGRQKDADQLYSAFNARLEQLNAVAERLERSSMAGAAQPVPHVAGDAVTTVMLSPCRNCTDQDAEQVLLCASVPAAATVDAVSLYSGTGDAMETGGLRPVEPEHEVDAGRYTGRPLERLDSDSSKQVCQTYLHWNTHHPRMLRIGVRYTHTQATAL